MNVRVGQTTVITMRRVLTIREVLNVSAILDIREMDCSVMVCCVGVFTFSHYTAVYQQFRLSGELFYIFHCIAGQRLSQDQYHSDQRCNHQYWLVYRRGRLPIPNQAGPDVGVALPIWMCFCCGCERRKIHYNMLQLTCYIIQI